MISYGKQSISQDDINEVVQVLTSDWLTQGPAIERFEKATAAYCGVKYAAAVSNATSALHIACLAAGLGRGDVLWTVPNTFAASANCALYCGANVDFVDIDEATYNMDAALLEKKLKSGTVRPKAVIPVHFAGQSCEMEKIHDLARRYQFSVIEDASHALGGEYQGRKVGCCAYSDMAVFSFHPVKMITTAEGGMVLTNSKELYDRLILYRSHGITRDPARMLGAPDGAWYYEQIALGFNYRMTDIQAALGFSQMKRLDAFAQRRRELAKRYDKLLEDLPLKTPRRHPDAKSSWHLYVARLCLDQVTISKREIFERMREKGVRLNLHYIPVHLQPYYRERGFCRGDFPASERYYEEAFTLPLYYDLSEADQDFVVKALREVL